VGVVDHHRGAVAIGEVADGVQRCEVAIHGKDGVGDDEGAAGSLPAEQPLQGVEIAVRVDA